ncbi:hypothetical protein [Cryptosporangium aurantiacum]|uniref:Tetratricopeptide repeat-containing protein n=1 Tax=Cryptosporangium aurantiacum TaxID=134849 RepID=A0A1M7QVC8_9ACTN|nr:hypothetical protein [Cryptosporangium aurantiacum]SHN35840.1 hypothetical protein SAMN05443668_105445 [Cryptosporangium aurantiacum]
MARGCVDLGLCGEAARVFFHESPAAALAMLPRQSTEPGTAWMLGAVLGAQGRYALAAAALRPLAESGSAAVANRTTPPGEDGLAYASLAWSTLASHQRQLGRHTEALHCDHQAAALLPALRTPAAATAPATATAPAAPTTPAVPTAPAAATAPAATAEGAAFDARFDAELGLAADAVGLGRADQAAERLAGVDALLASHPAQVGWRHRVRRGWVRTEIALLTGDAAAAVVIAEESLAEAIAANAPRHVAKCTLFLGASQYVRDRATPPRGAPERGAPERGAPERGAPDGVASERASARGASDGGGPAGVTLALAAARASAVGALPLLWVAESLRAEVADGIGDRAAAAEHRAAAAAAVRAVGDGLSPDEREAWLARPDFAALLR